MIEVPQAAIDLAKRFEGFCRVPKSDPDRAYPYVCPAGFGPSRMDIFAMPSICRLPWKGARLILLLT